MTPEIAAKIHEARIKAVRGDYTLDDIAEAIALYRAARGAVMTAVEVKKAKPAKPKKVKAGDALLDQILGETK
jgi:hypothetical protein